ncbi:MAG: M20/M25/M40 family metallo-hydrolase [Bacteroidetes bacterium]|nr:M20/M25/M40 family metallo-hydrolase [Bacteroidota bacterium]
MVKGQLDFLSSDWTEGRETGEKGMFMAADYIASMFMVYGLKPAGDIEWKYPRWFDDDDGDRPQKNITYFQNFNLIRYKPADIQEFSIIPAKNISNNEITFNYKTDFKVWPGATGFTYTGPVVFVGYGLIDHDRNYDDYQGIDVKGKVVMRLEGFPGHNDTTSAAWQIFKDLPEDWHTSPLYKKDDFAAEKGVVAVIEISAKGDMSGSWVVNYPFRYKTDYYEGDKPLPRDEWEWIIATDSIDQRPARITLSRRSINALLMNSGVNIEDFEKKTAETPKPNPTFLKETSIKLKVNVTSELVKARNVLGLIKGEDTTSYIVVGAHYDHLGKIDGYIFNGADDNASGTVGVMTLAKAWMATGIKPETNILFAAWTGEEKGLCGSEYFVNYSRIKPEEIGFNLNLDMISRDTEDDTLGLQVEAMYPKGNDTLKALISRNNEEGGLGLKIDWRPTVGINEGSDHSPFAEKKIPFIYYMAAFHPEYHQPSDETNKVDYDKMTRIIRLSFLNLLDINAMDLPGKK